MKRVFILPLCLTLISCSDELAPPAPERSIREPLEWPSMHTTLMDVPEGDCAFIGSQQTIGCYRAPLGTLMNAVNAGRRIGDGVITYAWITGPGGPTRCSVIVSGTWDNDINKVLEKVAQLREVLVTDLTEKTGPSVFCNDEGKFPATWEDGTPIKALFRKEARQ